MQSKGLAYYKRLPYRRAVAPLPEGGFIGRIAELPWVRIHGSTREEAFLLLDQTFQDAIAALLESGDDIAEPLLWPASVGGDDPNVKESLFAGLELKIPAHWVAASAPPFRKAEPRPWTLAPERGANVATLVA